MSKASAYICLIRFFHEEASDIFAYQLHKEAKTMRPPSPHHPQQLPHQSNSSPAPPDDVPDRTRPTPAPLMAPQRKKSSKGTTGVRAWLLMDSGGKTQVVEAGKHVIMRRTGLPARDLRILDPVLMYPSTVLGRERAIVINLEHIKAIVTAHEVLLVKSADPSVSPFVDELQRRLISHNQATTAALEGNEEDRSKSNWTGLHDLGESQSRGESRENSPKGFSDQFDEQGRVEKNQLYGSKVLPFEFVALEACLESACSCLENEAKRLEEEAYPALDKLSSKISTLNLERVRQIKSRLVAITGRVQRVRDELEHLLDDDEDMAEMYLTEKSVERDLEINSSASSSVNEPILCDEMDDEIVQADMEIDRDAQIGTTTTNTSKQLDVQELEMLLEAYFVQIDGILNKLSTLREYVDDTEDYINIMLDDKQNQLLQMGVVLSTATLVVSALIVVAGVFGMNVRIALFKESTKTGMPKFLWTVGGGSIGTIVLFVIAIACELLTFEEKEEKLKQSKANLPNSSKERDTETETETVPNPNPNPRSQRAMRAPNPIHHPSKSGPAEDDPDSTRPTMPGMGMSVAAGMRKKGLGVRPWLVLDASGQTQVVEAGKHAIMRRTGLPARDLRILDPLLSYPSTVLGRERAIVINLEHIKAIITAQEVLLLNSRDPSVTPFIDELQRRLLRHHQATTKPAKTQDKEGNGEESNWYDMEEAEADAQLRRVVGGNDEDEATGKQGLEENRDALKVLPFEFVALEACLEAACSCLENEARTLEQEAHPALDKLTSKISTLNLERVRQIKSRLVAITGRVQKVRDELEHLLDDDEDMAEMYLTEKLVQQHFENSTTSSLSEREDMDHEAPRRDMDDRIPTEISLEASGGSSNFEGDLQNPDNPQPQFLSRDSHGTSTSSTHSAMGKDLDVEELEMLLEAYFVQIDGTLNKLSTLREYVDDTEDYINIMLDDKQNHLLQMGVMLTTATLVVSAFVVVAGIFGMNIKIELFDSEKAGMRDFLWTVGGSTGGTIFLYVIAIGWCKHKRLLE